MNQGLDYERIADLTIEILLPIRANYHKGPISRDRAFKALNALAAASALVIQGCDDPHAIAHKFFLDALERNFESPITPQMKILKGILTAQRQVQIVTSLLEWARWMETSPLRTIAQDELDGWLISTIFLGVAYGSAREPLWFETMVFGPRGYPKAFDQLRYATYDEAVAGHMAMVEKIKTGNLLAK